MSGAIDEGELTSEVTTIDAIADDAMADTPNLKALWRLSFLCRYESSSKPDDSGIKSQCHLLLV